MGLRMLVLGRRGVRGSGPGLLWRGPCVMRYMIDECNSDDLGSFCLKVKLFL